MGGDIVSSYVYDTANQLIRENNQELGKTWTWTYDAAGNIVNRKEYAYTTAVTLGTPTDTVLYGYTDATWGDLLTSYDGTCDTYGIKVGWKPSYNWFLPIAIEISYAYTYYSEPFIIHRGYI